MFHNGIIICLLLLSLVAAPQSPGNEFKIENGGNEAILVSAKFALDVPKSFSAYKIPGMYWVYIRPHSLTLHQFVFLKNKHNVDL